MVIEVTNDAVETDAVNVFKLVTDVCNEPVVVANVVNLPS